MANSIAVNWPAVFFKLIYLTLGLVSASFVGSVVSSDEGFAETRKLKLHFIHTGERAEITYKVDGKYIEGGLKKINHLLRDWRRNEPTKMDPRLLDLIWEVYQETGSKKHIHVISAYRSPATNNLLRKRGRGVAKNSQHTRGKALDYFIPGVSLRKLRNIGLKKGLGGVGYYPKSGSPFVHMDTGRVRHWPRLNRKELAQVFPRGKTLHVPTDGKPLANFAQAKAEYNRKIARQGEIVIAKATEVSRRSGSNRRAISRLEEEGVLLGRNNTVARKPRSIETEPDATPASPPQQVPETNSPGVLIASLPVDQLPVPVIAPRPAPSLGAFEGPLLPKKPLPSETPEPETTVLALSEPQVPEPDLTDPALAGPQVPEPDITDPGLANPRLSEPETTVLALADPQPPEPDTSQTLSKALALTPAEIEAMRRQVYASLKTGYDVADASGGLPGVEEAEEDLLPKIHRQEELSIAAVIASEQNNTLVSGFTEVEPDVNDRADDRLQFASTDSGSGLNTENANLIVYPHFRLVGSYFEDEEEGQKLQELSAANLRAPSLNERIISAWKLASNASLFDIVQIVPPAFASDTVLKFPEELPASGGFVKDGQRIVTDQFTSLPVVSPSSQEPQSPGSNP